MSKPLRPADSERPYTPRRARVRPDAARRILHAAARRIVSGGAAALTTQDVAEEAGVSKGLIHYHFHDKTTLLARVAEWMGTELVVREQRALEGATPRTAIDQLWEWLSSELTHGHVRVLTELGSWHEPLVQRAVLEARQGRVLASETTLSELFDLLGLRPRIPPALVADVLVAFVDGLAAATSLDPELNGRAAFDVFWLALLGLGE